MWESFQENRVLKSLHGPVPIKIQGIRRQDGFAITHEQQDDPEFGNIEIFLCKGKFESFKFAATRYNAGEPTNTYEILLSIELTPNPTLVREHSKAIESALLNFPIKNRDNQEFVKKVVFNTKGSLAQAGEI